jgi:hypothetical protein
VPRQVLLSIERDVELQWCELMAKVLQQTGAKS